MYILPNKSKQSQKILKIKTELYFSTLLTFLFAKALIVLCISIYSMAISPVILGEKMVEPLNKYWRSKFLHTYLF